MSAHRTATLNDGVTQTLKAALRGQLIQPGHERYDDARRVYNAMHDRKPLLIVEASGVADVMATVKFAAEHHVLLALRGGAHSVPGFGTCDGGIVLDLKNMKGIRVDPERGTVRAEGGCTWGDLNHAAYAFGFATSGGVISTTGIAGLTLGGGLGYLNRRCGLSCDNLISADVVTADGTFLNCSESHEPDLFWALRGGGGNFGVVTSFEYRLHPVKDIYGGPTFFPLEAGVLRAFKDFIRQTPEQLGLLFGMTKAAPLPFLPVEWHSKPVSAVIACWTGAVADGENVLAPLKELGQVIGAYVAPMPYPFINTLFDQLLPRGLYHYWKGNFVRTLSDHVIRVHMENSAKTPTIQSGTFLYPMDGATARVSTAATAYAQRDAAFNTVITGGWPDPADNERNIRWVRDYYAALSPHSEAGGYVNFMDADDQGRVNANYGPNYKRLLEVKQKYDPANVFRVNQNIQ